MPPTVRVGAVNYLNTKPLIYELESSAPDAAIILDLPSRLADRLALGELDVALIPVVEYFRGRGYRILPGLSISGKGPVLSVTLFSRKPWRDIRSVALDEGSRTSAALTRILLSERYGIHPHYSALPIDARAEARPEDAVLLIGDRAMHACLPGFSYAYDLGKEWDDWTGLPFVYAVWAVRPGVELGETAAGLLEAKEQGCRHIGEIAYAEAPRLGLDAGFCRRYLENIIRYDLGEQELAGLKRFYELSVKHGLVREGARIEFYDSPYLVESR